MSIAGEEVVVPAGAIVKFPASVPHDVRNLGADRCVIMFQSQSAESPGGRGRGDHAALLRECTLERMEAAGSGGTAELLAWVLVLPFTRGPADVLTYMPAVAWRSGTGMVVWNELAR